MSEHTPSPAIGALQDSAAGVVSSPMDWIPEETLAASMGLPRSILRDWRKPTEKAPLFFRSKVGIAWYRLGVEKMASELSAPVSGLTYHPAEKSAPTAACAAPPAPSCVESEFPLRAQVTRSLLKNPRLIQARLEDTGDAILVRVDPKHMKPRPMFVPGMTIGVRFVKPPNLYATRKPRRPGKW